MIIKTDDTAQKMKLFQETADLVIFTEEILDGKLNFLSSGDILVFPSEQ